MNYVSNRLGEIDKELSAQCSNATKMLQSVGDVMFELRKNLEFKDPSNHEDLIQKSIATIIRKHKLASEVYGSTSLQYYLGYMGVLTFENEFLIDRSRNTITARYIQCNIDMGISRGYPTTSIVRIEAEALLSKFIQDHLSIIFGSLQLVSLLPSLILNTNDLTGLLSNRIEEVKNRIKRINTHPDINRIMQWIRAENKD